MTSKSLINLYLSSLSDLTQKPITEQNLIE